MIIFENKGEIDIRAIKTFGVSVKQDGAIGFFGTGLKYAISILLREGHDITIFSGKNRYQFDRKTIQVTGKDFDIVCMNDEELGFTTETGKTWKLWQAMRELYCNCTDEGGMPYKADFEEMLGKEGMTRIFVQGREFENIFDEIWMFILQTPPDVTTKYCDIYFNPSHSAYYKGVRVKDDMGHCLATYNIKEQIDLTEDRTAKYSFQVGRAIENAIVTLEDEHLIERLLCAPQGTFENELNFQHTTARPSEKFLGVCKYLAENQNINLNEAALFYAKKYAPIDNKPKEYKPLPHEIKQVERAIELLGIAGFKVLTYPVVYVETLGQGVYAQAAEGRMFISKLCFSKGTKFIAHAFLEEYWHLEHGFKDHTREFQTFLFDNILTLIERLNKEAF